MNNELVNLSEMAFAWERRDPSYDGLFVFGVRTTGIFCRPSCPSQPLRENMEFFQSTGEAVRAGYRPCKRCQPELANGAAPDWVANLMRRAEESEGRISPRDLGVAPEKARRWFQKNHGMTFAAWQRGLRLSRAFTQIRQGEGLDDVALGNGFESHSGFRTAFGKVFGATPAKPLADCLRVALLETPIGPMLAAVNSRAVVQLEFADRRGLERSYAEMRKRFGVAAIPGDNEVMAQLRRELTDYISGQRRNFEVLIETRGTPFQEKVWRELMKIPHGETRSYEQIATRIGSPTAVRAVARANGTNRIYLVIPCHRVIAKNGELSGYGGGVHRKQWLLNLEKK